MQSIQLLILFLINIFPTQVIDSELIGNWKVTKLEASIQGQKLKSTDQEMVVFNKAFINTTIELQADHTYKWKTNSKEFNDGLGKLYWTFQKSNQTIYVSEKPNGPGDINEHKIKKSDADHFTFTSDDSGLIITYFVIRISK
ncbi:MAG: hypothetical protein H7329_08390 [Opitutaceae bacterium]|nr:hypothetical protein [Cytophagales bacterium]